MSYTNNSEKQIEMKLNKLFEPITVGTMDLKNRIVMTGFSLINEESPLLGHVTQRYIDFFEERAKGGVGLIILPDTVIEKQLCTHSQICIDDDEFNPGLSALTDAVHAWGTKIAPDLLHFGYRVHKQLYPFLRDQDNWRPISPSPIPYAGIVSREMNTEEIKQVEEEYANAALRSKQTGFDAIQLAGGFGFLINQFLSPYFNKRTDKYGGSLENRMRFAIEVIDCIKAKIGESLPIIFRLSAEEYIDGGLTIKDTQIIARKLQDAGAGLLNVAVGLDLHGQLHNSIFPMGFSQGPIVDLAARIKDVVTIPVAVVGRITIPTFAEKVLADGKADLVAIARQLAADPEWPRKAAEDRFQDIVPCIGCNVCLQRIIDRKTSRCSVNAAMGRERDFNSVTVTMRKKVLTIGGGPAGMEAARIAATRGHKVLLYEKEDALGGQLVISSKPPYRHELRQFTEYLVRQLQNLQVEIHLGTEVTEELLEDIAPDVIIAATGAVPDIPDIPGINGPNVVTVREILSQSRIGSKVVIIGGGLIGCVAAEYLISKGKRVTVVETHSELAVDAETTNRSALLERFDKYTITVITDAEVTSIDSTGVIVTEDGKETYIGADYVVNATGMVSNNSLAKKLLAAKKNVYPIGDCLKPARIMDAVNQAAIIANQI